MKESILMSLDTINDVVCESEIAAAEAILAEYDKAITILEYSETDSDQFIIFQEGKIMDDVKKQGEGQSKVMRILTLIPRLISALFKAITGKLKSTEKSAKNIKEKTKDKDPKNMKEFIGALKKGDKKAVKTALNGLGTVAGLGVGAVGVAHGIREIDKKYVSDEHIIRFALSEEDYKKYDDCMRTMDIIFSSLIDEKKLEWNFVRNVTNEEFEEYKKALDTCATIYKKIGIKAIHKAMKTVMISSIRKSLKETKAELDSYFEFFVEMSKHLENDGNSETYKKAVETAVNSKKSVIKNIEEIEKELSKMKDDEGTSGSESNAADTNTDNKSNSQAKLSGEEHAKIPESGKDDKTSSNNTSTKSDSKTASIGKNDTDVGAVYISKYEKIIDRMITTFNDLTGNTGDINLFDLVYASDPDNRDNASVLLVRYNSSVVAIPVELEKLISDIVNNPGSLKRYEEFSKRYSTSSTKYKNSKYKTVCMCIDACQPMHTGAIGKDKLSSVTDHQRIMNSINKNNTDLDKFISSSKDKLYDELNRHPEAVKAVENIGDILKTFQTETIAYLTMVGDAIGVLEDLIDPKVLASHSGSKSNDSSFAKQLTNAAKNSKTSDDNKHTKQIGKNSKKQITGDSKKEKMEPTSRTKNVPEYKATPRSSFDPKSIKVGQRISTDKLNQILHQTGALGKNKSVNENKLRSVKLFPGTQQGIGSDGQAYTSAKKINNNGSIEWVVEYSVDAVDDVDVSIVVEAATWYNRF